MTANVTGSDSNQAHNVEGIPRHIDKRFNRPVDISKLACVNSTVLADGVYGTQHVSQKSPQQQHTDDSLSASSSPISAAPINSNTNNSNNSSIIAVNQNKHITDILESLQNVYVGKGDDFRYVTYR